jgi:hypothetical protein
MKAWQEVLPDAVRAGLPECLDASVLLFACGSFWIVLIAEAEALPVKGQIRTDRKAVDEAVRLRD